MQMHGLERRGNESAHSAQGHIEAENHLQSLTHFGLWREAHGVRRSIWNGATKEVQRPAKIVWNQTIKVHACHVCALSYSIWCKLWQILCVNIFFLYFWFFRSRVLLLTVKEPILRRRQRSICWSTSLFWSYISRQRAMFLDHSCLISLGWIESAVLCGGLRSSYGDQR